MQHLQILYERISCISVYMESPGRFTNKQVKHTTIQNLSDQSKQDIPVHEIIEGRKNKTKHMPGKQPNEQPKAM